MIVFAGLNRRPRLLRNSVSLESGFAGLYSVWSVTCLCPFDRRLFDGDRNWGHIHLKPVSTLYHDRVECDRITCSVVNGGTGCATWEVSVTLNERHC